MSAETIKSVYFNGPPLVLTEDSDVMRSQLTNLKLAINPHQHPLAPGVTTDAIIPADACKTLDPYELARHVLTGWTEGIVHPGDIEQLYPNVWVAGDNFGSGSSREHAPIAIQFAGGGLIIAKSFAPILRRNAVALGLYTSTNFDLLDLLKNKKPIPLELLTQDLDPLSRDILESGGLLPYLQHVDQGRKKIPKITTQARPMTIAEKWLAQYLDVPYVKSGDGGFIAPDLAYSYEYTAPWSMFMLNEYLGKQHVSIHNPQKLVLFNDHLPLDDDPRSYALEEATRQIAKQYGIKLFDAAGNRHTSQGQLAICHIKMADLVKPGVHVGTDSHTPMIAPFGGYAFGVGATDFAAVMYKGITMVTVPESVKIDLQGNLLPHVTARDLMLYLIAHNLKQKTFLGRVMEFGGSSLSDLTPLDLAVMANMTAEARAVTATFEPHRGVAEALTKSGRFRNFQAALAAFPISDHEAIYHDVVHVDLHTIPPTIATPSSPDTGKPLDQIPPAKLNKVIVGACVGGGIEDIRLTAHIVRDKHIPSGLELIVHPHSTAAMQYAEQRGWIRWIEEAGGKINYDIGCGECINNGPGILQEHDVCITSDSRNHEGRMGHPKAKVYLASSVVCAVSALVGGIPTMNDIYKYTRAVPWKEKVSLFSLKST